MAQNGLSQHSMEAVPMATEEKQEREKEEKEEEKKEEEEEYERDHWGKHLDYMLSLVGYCVGLGNLWRFPYLCNRNGGGAFLIPFLFFLLVCGVPLFFLESALGQFSGRSSVAIWEICPLFKGVGVGVNFFSAVTTVYYNTVMAWAIYYLVRSCASLLPWTTCSNPWNSPFCFVRGAAHVNASTSYNVSMGTNVTLPTSLAGDVEGNAGTWKNTTLSHTAAEEFWQYGTLNVSEGMESLGEIQWQLALCLLAAWAIVCACVIKGVKSVGKVVYFTATVPYLLLTVLLIRGLTLDGAVDGIVFYLKPDFRKLLEVQVWLEAAAQVFYSLGPAWGGIITMSSYNRFHNNCLRDAVVLSLVCEGTSLYAGLVVFSMLGYMAKVADVPISEVVSSGPGLGFVVYPEALSTLPLPQIWSFLFFLMLLTVGLDSLFAMTETYLTTLLDAFHRVLKNRRSLMTLAACVASFLVSLIFVTNGGVYVFQLIDWYLSPMILFTTSTLECIVVVWIYGLNRFERDVDLMIGRRVPFVLRILLCFVSPAITFILLITTLLQYSPPTYGKYVYPKYAEIVGWTLQVIPVLPIPAVMVWEIYKRKGPIKERFRQALQPSPRWQPAERRYQEAYHARPLPRRSPLPSNVCSQLACRK